jgi:hypothetical protein
VDVDTYTAWRLSSVNLFALTHRVLPASLLFDDSLASCESFANMSAKYYGTTHRHPFKWDDVASAIFMRYPNPLATHVLTEDTLYREIRGGVLYSRRFLTKTNRLPKWGERFFSNLKKFVPLVEESHVDPKSRVVTTYTRNVGLSRFMVAIEKVRYIADPDNPNETIAIKEAWIESGLYGLRYYLHKWQVDRLDQQNLLFSGVLSKPMAWIDSSKIA